MRSKEKQVQIPYDLLTDLCRYHLAGITDDPEIEERIRAGLRDKMDSAAAVSGTPGTCHRSPVILSDDMFTPPLRGCFLLTGL